MAGKGDNSIAKAQLRAYFERLERLNEEIDDLNKDKSEVFAEARANGYDAKIMRIVLSRRQMDRTERQERDALIELYEGILGLGLGGKSGTKVATRARAGDEETDDE